MFDKMSELYPQLAPFDDGDRRQVVAALVACVKRLGGDVTIPMMELVTLADPEPRVFIYTDPHLNLRIMVEQT
jgi:hypothetical protein